MYYSDFQGIERRENMRMIQLIFNRGSNNFLNLAEWTYFTRTTDKREKSANPCGRPLFNLGHFKEVASSIYAVIFLMTGFFFTRPIFCTIISRLCTPIRKKIIPGEGSSKNSQDIYGTVCASN